MNVQALLDAINYKGVVSGLTHDFYRYPARFSPLFARAAIEHFSEPGDTVLDPFTGCGTSLVEAFARGRNAVGVDISELAVFLARVKTTVLREFDLDLLRAWAHDTVPTLSPRKPVDRHQSWKDAGYQVNMPWRYRKVAEQALNGAAKLPKRLQPVARCIVLKSVQWAVDCKNQLPSAAEFREQVIEDAIVVTEGLRALREQVLSLGSDVKQARVEAFKARAEDISGLPSEFLGARRPKLVVTSPPYPGIHVLYHRWQIGGRKETPAPFWIAECQDGQGASYYTFGDRRHLDHDERYFDRLLRSYAEVRKVVSDDCVVVQLVGFARPDEHLPLYMDAMSAAGFDEFDFEQSGHRTRREDFWRAVPNRKWYTWLRPDAKQASEILLIHRAR